MDKGKLRSRAEKLLKDDETILDAEDLASALQETFADYSRHKIAVIAKSLTSILPNNAFHNRFTPVVSDRDQAMSSLASTSTTTVNTPATITTPSTTPADDGPMAKRARRQEQKPSFSFAVAPTPNERLDDVCGLDKKIMSRLMDLIVRPMREREAYERMLGGLNPMTGLLLCGAPGTGKSLLARALAGETGAAFYPLNATEIVSGVSGESETKLRELFDAARSTSPSIILIDDIDAICPGKSNGRELERRMVSQLTACLDGLKEMSGVVVIATTSKQDALDSSLRRSGRFDTEICLGMPDLNGRAEMLRRMSSALPCSPDLNFHDLAKLTFGYVGADISRLVIEAAVAAAKRCVFDSEEIEAAMTGVIEHQDFLQALPLVQPSSRREGFTTVPSITWEDVGALKNLKEDLDDTICLPIRRAAIFEKLLGSKRQNTYLGGVLLFGPPGCGKTLLAKAVANASGASFISVKGPELLNKYVGESERAVRQVFARAATSAPCVIFFDEIDALCPRRNAENTGAQERVVNQMLTEMDGASGITAGVFVVAATNRPDMVDAAMLRPGRLGKLLYVPLPDEEGRADILRSLIRHSPCDADIDIAYLANKTVRFSGADLNALFREAVNISARRQDRLLSMMEIENPTVDTTLTKEDFVSALSKVKASVSEEAEISYLKLQQLQSVSRD